MNKMDLEYKKDTFPIPSLCSPKPVDTADSIYTQTTRNYFT